MRHPRARRLQPARTTSTGRSQSAITVFVHVDKLGDLPRAERLATHLGGTVLRAVQHGW
ncbi:hypothetical protein ACFY1C_32015 [Streptomyces sp. NPDC001279]|uniref:hypothetical protein n=1 Tax=Streptomyces sp. NPDC001279 TaxID=3364556 RepID=UPI0036A047D8